MKTMKTILPIVVIFALVSTVTSCTDYLPDTGLTGQIVTGPSTEVLSENLGSQGGTLIVTADGSPIKGMELTVEPGSFVEGQKVEIAWSEIRSHQFGTYFNPITPLISIQTSDLYSEKPMSLKIPIQLASGDFAMGFIYDPVTGYIEGLPTLELTSSYIRIASLHFASDSTRMKSSGEEVSGAQAQVVVGMITSSFLDDKLMTSSGFEPGKDDWEFGNHPTYIQPLGHTLGMSLGAVWYFQEKMPESGRLYHRFDSMCTSPPPDEFWMDNSIGIRWSSAMQGNARLDSWKTVMAHYGVNESDLWKSVYVCILTFHNPQILLARNYGKNQVQALVCYKIDTEKREMYVWDPNDPGDSGRIIPYTDNTIGPYQSTDPVDNEIRTYDEFGFFQLTNLIDPAKVSQLWNQFQDKSIGEQGYPGREKFPAYAIEYGPEGGTTVSNGFTVSNPDFRIVCRSNECSGFIQGTNHLQPFEIWSAEGIRVSEAYESTRGVGAVQLPAGDLDLGLYIDGIRDDGINYYLDFVWLKVTYEKVEVSISPDPMVTAANTNCTFTAQVTGKIPSDVKYVWNFGDGTDIVTVNNTKAVDHSFSLAGDFDITCTLFDRTNNQQIAVGTSKAEVQSTLLAELKATEEMFISFDAYMLADNGELVPALVIDGEWHDYNRQKLSWNGRDFTIGFSYHLPGNGTDSLMVSGSLKGTVSTDGQMLQTLTAQQKKEFKSKTGYWREDKIELTSIPLSSNDNIGIKYNKNGPGCRPHVSSLTISYYKWNQNTGEWRVLNLSSIDYNESYMPNLRVEFYK